MLFFNFIILLLDPDPDPAGSEKVGSVTSLIYNIYIYIYIYKIVLWRISINYNTDGNKIHYI